jgi:putative endonuclease
MAVPTTDLGRRGEDLAARCFEAAGFVVLSRNWRCREGELDLVATDGTTLVVCEVKTRSSAVCGPPSAAVTRAKIQKVRRATWAWLRRYGCNQCAVRFDVMSVHWPKTGRPVVEYLRGAF